MAALAFGQTFSLICETDQGTPLIAQFLAFRVKRTRANFSYLMSGDMAKSALNPSDVVEPPDKETLLSPAGVCQMLVPALTPWDPAGIIGGVGKVIFPRGVRSRFGVGGRLTSLSLTSSSSLPGVGGTDSGRVSSTPKAASETARLTSKSVSKYLDSFVSELVSPCGISGVPRWPP